MGRRWTEDDVNNLQLLAQRHPVPKIAEIMDRTVGGIIFKAHQLKISLRSHNQQRVATTIGERVGATRISGSQG